MMKIPPFSQQSLVFAILHRYQASFSVYRCNEKCADHPVINRIDKT